MVCRRPAPAVYTHDHRIVVERTGFLKVLDLAHRQIDLRVGVVDDNRVTLNLLVTNVPQENRHIFGFNTSKSGVSKGPLDALSLDVILRLIRGPLL